MQKDKYIFRSKTILSFVCFVVGVLVSVGCVQAWAVERAVCNEALTATGPVVTVARFNRFRESVTAAFKNYHASTIQAGRRMALIEIVRHFEAFFEKSGVVAADALQYDIQLYGVPREAVYRLGDRLTPMVLAPTPPGGAQRASNSNEGVRLRRVLVQASRSGTVVRQWQLEMPSPHHLETSLQWLWWAQGLGLDLTAMGFTHPELWPAGRGAWYGSQWPYREVDLSELERVSATDFIAPESAPFNVVPQNTNQGAEPLTQVLALATNRPDGAWASLLSAAPSAPYSDPRNFMALAGADLSRYFGFLGGARIMMVPTIAGWQTRIAELNTVLPSARQIPFTVEGVPGRRSDGALQPSDPAQIVNALIGSFPRILLAQDGPLALHDGAVHTAMLLLPPEILHLLIRQYRLVVAVVQTLKQNYGVSDAVESYVVRALARRFDVASGNFGVDVGRLATMAAPTTASFERWPLDRIVHFGFERLVFGGDAPSDVVTEWLKNVLQEDGVIYQLPPNAGRGGVSLRSGESLQAILEGIVMARGHAEDAVGLEWSPERFLGALQSRIQELERAAQTVTSARAERR